LFYKSLLTLFALMLVTWSPPVYANEGQYETLLQKVKTAAKKMIASKNKCSVKNFQTNQILPFTSDGCSMFPDGEWKHCCFAHDATYWVGGTQVERYEADLLIKKCIAQSGHPVIARIMYRGIRVGGRPSTGRSYRWGYGWSYPIGYRKLNFEQLQSAQNMWQAYELLDLGCERTDITEAREGICASVEEMRRLMSERI